MAAFEGHDEPSDDDDDGSLNTSGSSFDEQQMLPIHNNDINRADEPYVQQTNE